MSPYAGFYGHAKGYSIDLLDMLLYKTNLIVKTATCSVKLVGIGRTTRRGPGYAHGAGTVASQGENTMSRSQ